MPFHLTTHWRKDTMASPEPTDPIETTTPPHNPFPVTRVHGIHPTIITGSVLGGVSLLLAVGVGIFYYRKRRQWRRMQRELPTVVVTCPTTATLASAPPSSRDERDSASSYIAPPGFATNPALARPGPEQYLTPEARSWAQSH